MRVRGSLLRGLLTAVALGMSALSWAVPEPKVSVIFDVTNDNQLLVAPATIEMSAEAFARQQNHPIVAVEFYDGTSLIARVAAAPFVHSWSNVAAGSYSLAARAINDKGDSATSPPIAVQVDAPPTVTLTSPANGAVIPAAGSLTLAANATDADGSIAKVEFYAGTTLIGTATGAPYTAVWNNAPPGPQTLTASATDNLGASTVSASVAVVVNAAPAISLALGGAPYIAPANATLTATASDADGSIAKVEFFSGTTLIGTATTSPYTVTLNALAAGNYLLTAKATDNVGDTAISGAVPLTVVPNQLPTVALTSPTANQVVAAPANLTLAANANDTDGTVTKVEFFSGTTLIGTATTAPYTAAWNNVPAGTHSLTAVATDDKGGVTPSSPVSVTVDAPPTVDLTSPSAGAVQLAPASFTLTASAGDADGSIAKVEFFNGSTLIGTATSSPYTISWANVPAGSYTLTAVATDNLGMQTTSAPVNVSVIANSAPTITLTSPTQGQGFKAPATVTLAAEASDPDNNLAKVEFFQGSTLIATVLSPPYMASWNAVGQGTYQITAVATDAYGAQATSTPVTVTVTPAQAGLYFIHPDHLGTPRLVTDSSNAVVWRHLPTTEPFGNTPPEEDPNATGSRFEMPLAFAGQYRDRETSTHYNFYRDHYFPGQGRYGQSDPIGLDGGINTYSYVGGNPVSFVDPLGLNPAAGAAAGGMVGGPVGAVIGGAIGLGVGLWTGNELGIFSKPPENARDPNGPKAPGKPGEGEGFNDPKGGENWVPNPNGRGAGWEDAKGDVWCPTGQGGSAHGGPHWDVQTPGGGYRNVRPRR